MGKNHLGRQSLPEAYQQIFEDENKDWNCIRPGGDLKRSLGMWGESETTAVCTERDYLAVSA